MQNSSHLKNGILRSLAVGLRKDGVRSSMEEASSERALQVPVGYSSSGSVGGRLSLIK
jgi:hypothetical protein